MSINRSIVYAINTLLLTTSIMALKPFQLSFLIFLVLVAFSAIGHATRSKHSSVFDFIKQLQGCHKGNTSKDILGLKTYLAEFGYLDKAEAADDSFDDAVESAVKTYKKNFHLTPTGTLDSATVSTMVTPRCGVADIINGTNFMRPNRTDHGHGPSSSLLHILSNYSFFPGNPRWNKKQLSFMFLPGFPTAAMNPVRSAFQKWTNAVSCFTFVEAQTNADLTVGWYRLAHGDDAPFDGPGGILAHAYAPTDGRFHYDSDEQWSVRLMPNSFDLENVAVHQIGHLLGLGHSQVQAAIMFPSISAGTTKNIEADDIQGIRALYGC